MELPSRRSSKHLSYMCVAWVQPPLYMVMHTTQFAEPGCHYVENVAVADNGWCVGVP